jgi:hypothetical protein
MTIAGDLQVERQNERIAACGLGTIEKLAP